MYSNRKADSLSERVAALENALAAAERQASAQRQRAETAERNEAVLRVRVKVAEDSERTARVEGARTALAMLEVHFWGKPVTLQAIAEWRERAYPATGEEPTRGKKPNLGMPYTRCRACDSLRDWEGRCDDCDGPRPAPPAVTEPPLPLRLSVITDVERDEDEPFSERTTRFVDITPEDARAIVALASRLTASGEG